MSRLLLIVLFLQFLIPLALLAWLALVPPRSRVVWALRTITVGAFILSIGLAGLWVVGPRSLPLLYIPLFVFAAWRSARLSGRAPPGRSHRLSIAAHGIVAVGCVALAGHVLLARNPPAAETVTLEFPLRQGSYYVANGGSRQIVNSHLVTLQARYAAHRGQSYGVDLLKVDRWGLRARGVLPRDPAAYRIFGDTVHAPCAGIVRRSRGDLPDLSPPRRDTENMSGNHVLLECGPVWVLLAHLRQGSLHVVEGDHVSVGQPLGQVGNTGNTDEPHLHIHAQRPGSAAAPFSGAPLVIRFGEVYPVRNDILRRPTQRAGPPGAESKLEAGTARIPTKAAAN